MVARRIPGGWLVSVKRGLLDSGVMPRGDSGELVRPQIHRVRREKIQFGAVLAAGSMHATESHRPTAAENPLELYEVRISPVVGSRYACVSRDIVDDASSEPSLTFAIDNSASHDCGMCISRSTFRVCVDILTLLTRLGPG